MPPYWALGFHLCRYGYNSAENLKKVINRNRQLGIPYVSTPYCYIVLVTALDGIYDTHSFAVVILQLEMPGYNRCYYVYS